MSTSLRASEAKPCASPPSLRIAATSGSSFSAVRRVTQATKPSRAKRRAIAPPVESPAPITSTDFRSFTCALRLRQTNNCAPSRLAIHRGKPLVSHGRLGETRRQTSPPRHPSGRFRRAEQGGSHECARLHQPSPGRRCRLGDGARRGARRHVRRRSGRAHRRRCRLRRALARGPGRHARRPAHPRRPGHPRAARRRRRAGRRGAARPARRRPRRRRPDPAAARRGRRRACAEHRPAGAVRAPLAPAAPAAAQRRVARRHRPARRRPARAGPAPAGRHAARHHAAAPAGRRTDDDTDAPRRGPAGGGRRRRRRPPRRPRHGDGGPAPRRRLGRLALAAAPGREPLGHLAGAHRPARRADLARGRADARDPGAEGSQRRPLEHRRHRDRPAVGRRARGLEGAHRQRT